MQSGLARSHGRFLPSPHKILDLLDFQDGWRAFADNCGRLRSFGGNIIALATAERNLVVP
jgi:hypothetical protein